MTMTHKRNDSQRLPAYGRVAEAESFDPPARRHVDMISTMSLRRYNHWQPAKKSAQKVLIRLSRNVPKLSTQEKNVTGWLHASPRFEVANLQRGESRLGMIEKGRQTRVESHSCRELSPVLNPTEDPENRTFELLQTSSEATVKTSADIHAFMALPGGS